MNLLNPTSKLPHVRKKRRIELDELYTLQIQFDQDHKRHIDLRKVHSDPALEHPKLR